MIRRRRIETRLLFSLLLLLLAANTSHAVTPPPFPATPLFPLNTNVPPSLTDAPTTPPLTPLPTPPVDTPFDRPTLPAADEFFRTVNSLRHQIDIILPSEFPYNRLPLLYRWLEEVVQVLAGEADAEGTVSALFDNLEARQFSWQVRAKMELEGLGLRVEQNLAASTTTSTDTTTTSSADVFYAQSAFASQQSAGIEPSLSAGADGRYVNYATSGCYKFGFQTMCTIVIIPRTDPKTEELIAPLPQSPTILRRQLLSNPILFTGTYLQGSNETDILCDALAVVLETAALGSVELQRVRDAGIRVPATSANISDLLALKMPFAAPTATAAMRDRDVFFALTETSTVFDPIATLHAQSLSIPLYDALRRVGVSGARCVKPAAVSPPSASVGINIYWILFIALGCFSAALTVFLLVRSNVDPPTLQSRAAREAEEEAERVAQQEERRSARRRARSLIGSDTTSQRGANSVELMDRRLKKYDEKKMPHDNFEDLEQQRQELVEKNTAAFLIQRQQEIEKRELEAAIHRPMTRAEKAMIAGGSTIYGAKPDKRSLRNMALDAASTASQSTVLKSPKDRYGRIQQPFYGKGQTSSSKDPLGMYDDAGEDSYVQPMKIMLEHDRMFQLPPTEEELALTRQQVAQRLLMSGTDRGSPAAGGSDGGGGGADDLGTL